MRIRGVGGDTRRRKEKEGMGNREEEIMWEEDSVGADQDWVELADCPTQLIS